MQLGQVQRGHRSVLTHGLIQPSHHPGAAVVWPGSVRKDRLLERDPKSRMVPRPEAGETAALVQDYLRHGQS